VALAAPWRKITTLVLRGSGSDSAYRKPIHPGHTSRRGTCGTVHKAGALVAIVETSPRTHDTVNLTPEESAVYQLINTEEFAKLVGLINVSGILRRWTGPNLAERPSEGNNLLDPTAYGGGGQ
jgi:hypothetical protein